jgi:hypothetical protein
MASIDDIARDFTNMLRAGQFEAAGKRYWADAITSIEPAALSDDIPARVSGVAAVHHKNKARFGECLIEELGIDGPFITGNQFALFLDMLIADQASGHAKPFTAIAIFTVCAGRIFEERFFYD